MLGKLIKYEMRACARYFIPIFIAILLVFAGNGFTLKNFGNSDGDLFSVIMMVLLIAIISIFIFLSLYVTVKRFASSVFGDEGYLTNTLPVNTTQIIFSKAITIVIYSFISGLVFLVATMLLILPNMTSVAMFNIREGILNIFKLFNQSNFNIPLFTAEIIVGSILSSFLSVFSIYLSVAVAHMKQCINHKYIYGFITYFVFTLATNTLVSRISDLVINKDMLSTSIVVGRNDVVEALNIASTYFNRLFTVSIVLTLILTIIAAIITNYILNRHLNVE